MPTRESNRCNPIAHNIVSALAIAALAVTLAPNTADAFCGFYVSGADAKLYNNATMVVMMRDGQRTVLSMQNNYEGPPSDFAMVVPVPVVLQKENVKTLENAVFDKVDKMAAPRLVEYWEVDPCMQEIEDEKRERMRGAPGGGGKYKTGSKKDGGVKIEAQFKVGEYEIVVLSAKDSGGLDRWLRQNKYNIPAGAEPMLKPYVESGMYFFVAKVDADKVKFNAQKQAMLSPLRFHYDTPNFALPIRLGLLNAKGDQDLIVHILARGQRYEAANYKNVTIPTNINVSNDVRKQFGSFYTALFDKTLSNNPGSVVTEYAWDASTCDPCPGPNLNSRDFLALGADVLKEKPTRGFVLTRLHARYNSKNLGEDMVFKAAAPILGGREVLINKYQAEQKSQSGSVNNFQGRYIIRHAWEGKIACQNPVRGRWGGPPGSGGGNWRVFKGKPEAAQNTAFAPRGKVELAKIARQDIPELKLTAVTNLKSAFEKKGGNAEQGKTAPDPKDKAPTKDQKPNTAQPDKKPEPSSEKGCSAAPGVPENSGLLSVFALLAWSWIRRRSSKKSAVS